MDVSTCQIDLSPFNPKLLKMILVNPKLRDSTQRSLALLGDSLFGLFARELYFRKGYSKILATILVTNQFLAGIVKHTKLVSLLPKEVLYKDRDLGTVLEALIGAMYWQNGFEETKKYFQKEIQPFFEKGNVFFHKFQKELRLIMQKEKNPEISLVAKCQELSMPRPIFCKSFKKPRQKGLIFSRVVVSGILDITSSGRTKKEAMQSVSLFALWCLEKKCYPLLNK